MRQLAVLTCLVGILGWCGLGWSATITVTTTEPGVNADGLCSFAEAVDNVREGNVHADCVAGEVTGNTIELGENETYLLEEPHDEYHTGEYPLVIKGNGSTLVYLSILSIQGPDVAIRDLNSGGGTVEWKTGYSYPISSGSFEAERCRFGSDLGLVIQVGGNAEGIDLTIKDTVFGGEDIGVVIVDESPQENLYRFVDCDFEESSLNITCHTVPSLLRVDGCRFTGDGFIGIGWGLSVVGARAEITRTSFVGTMSGISVYSSDSGIPANLVVSNCTFSSNQAGIFVSEPIGPSPDSVSVKHSTFVQNGASLRGWLNAISIESTVLAAGHLNFSQSCDHYSYPETAPSSNGFNIADDFTCNLDHHTDMIVLNVMLSELGYFGGRTPVHMPHERSLVIDMGNTNCPRKDQRGYKRPTDGNGDGVAVCDCGAVEYNSYPLPVPFEPDFGAALNE
jgi:hypothetical protein